MRDCSLRRDSQHVISRHNIDLFLFMVNRLAHV